MLFFCLDKLQCDITIVLLKLLAFAYWFHFVAGLYPAGAKSNRYQPSLVQQDKFAKAV